MPNASKLIQEMQTYYHHRTANYDASMGYDWSEMLNWPMSLSISDSWWRVNGC